MASSCLAHAINAKRNNNNRKNLLYDKKLEEDEDYKNIY